MTGITILKPLTITPAMLVSCDVPETDYLAYAAGTTYAASTPSAVVRVIDNHVIYQSLQAANTGHTPATSPTWWVVVGATNRWKMFDLVNSSQTAQGVSMSYVLRPGTVVTAVAAVNLKSVQTVRVRMISDAYGLVYDKTITRTRTPPGQGWWNWFFGRRSESLTSYYEDLPSFLDAQILVDFTGLADMAVGTLMLGTVSTWGKGVTYGASLGIRDYSKKETNEWGEVVLTQRTYARKLQFTLVLDSTEVDPLYRYLGSLRAVACLWIVSDLYSSMVVYGYYQDFDVLIAYPKQSDCNLTLEGLT